MGDSSPSIRAPVAPADSVPLEDAPQLRRIGLDYLAERMQAAIDKALPPPDPETPEAIAKYRTMVDEIREKIERPEARARARLRAAFNAVIVDPDLAEAPEIRRFVAQMRESIDLAPFGSTAEQMMNFVHRYVSHMVAKDNREKAAKAQWDATSSAVLEKWTSLPEKFQGRYAAGVIATQLHMSQKQVGKHLEALNLRSKRT